MAGSISDYLENAWLNHILKGTAFTQPTNLYLALSTADPTDAGSGLAEPSGSYNYARVQCNTSWAAAASRAVSSNADITFNQAQTGSWGTITHWALLDNSTGGNLLAHGDFTSSKVVGIGVTPKILSGNLTITVSTGGMTTDLANKMLDHTLKGTSFSQPTNIYVGLSTANPTDSMGSLAEPGSGAYARKNHNSYTITNNTATNNGAFAFTTATGSWGTITHHFLSTNSSGGTYLFYGAVDTQQAISTDDIVNYADGALDFTLS